MARVLFTGGLGFIGSNLVPESEKCGHEAWVCGLGHSEGPGYVSCDVSKYRQLERIFDQHKFDCVYRTKDVSDHFLKHSDEADSRVIMMRQRHSQPQSPAP